VPPAKPMGEKPALLGPPSPVAPVNRLQKIDFDETHPFKAGDDKLPLCFMEFRGVCSRFRPCSGIELEAQPWRQRVSLQSSGRIRVAGDVAGTSTRLRPRKHCTGVRHPVAGYPFALSSPGLRVRGVFSWMPTRKAGSAKEDATETGNSQC